MSELLAPAGDMETFYCSLAAGADAVYLGTNFFNARMGAKNFSFDEIKKATIISHSYNKKIYVTLNTLIFDAEFEKLFEIVEKLMEINVDAFIIQDLGVASILKERFPNICLHASTQMCIHNIYGAKMAEQMGISRVVLSRECQLSEIKKIKAETNLEVEYFVQGALCVCLSGNCYLSEQELNRSGNRGNCAQLCRLNYQAFCDNQEVGSGYLLSAKDLCMAKKMKQLIEANVDSFKIEGRARRGEYIYNATAAYREIIDQNKIDEKQIDKLKLAFNRGDFCQGYLDGNKDVIFKKSQAHSGLAVGKVLEIKRGKNYNEIIFTSKVKLNKLDAIKIFRNQNEITMISLFDLKNLSGNKYSVTTKNSCLKGDEVNLVSQKQELNFEEKFKLPLNLKLIFENNLKAEIKFQDKVFYFQSEFELQPAKNMPLSKENFKNCFGKTDNLFKLMDIHFENFKPCFVQISKLNDFRRKIYDSVKNEIISAKSAVKIAKTQQIAEKLNVNSDNLSCKYITNYDEIQNDTPFDFYILSPDDYLNFKYDRQKNIKYNVYLDLPKFLTSEEIEMMKKIAKNNFNGVVANNISHLTAFKNFSLIGGYYLNINNIYSENFVKKHGVVYLLKNKFNARLLQTIEPSNFELDLMTFVHCPFKTIYGSECGKTCKYNPNLIYQKQDGKKYRIIRKKIATCYFYLRNC